MFAKRMLFIGNLVNPSMRVVRATNGDVVIEGIDPDNMDRLNQTAIRMSAAEWDMLIERFAEIAKYI